VQTSTASTILFLTIVGATIVGAVVTWKYFKQMKVKIYLRNIPYRCTQGSKKCLKINNTGMNESRLLNLTPNYSKVMSRDKYCLLRSILHLNNNNYQRW
jgi:hypothetical protein